jgi:glutaconate CoA-transferase subunit A
MAEELIRLVEGIADGDLLALPPEYSFVPMAAIRALVARPARDLRLLVVPVGGMGVDMLIGAECVASVEAAAVSLGEAGPAPCFVRAVQNGDIVMRDSTCPAIHTSLQAAEKGVPFMPLGGLVGSDLVKNRDDWRVVDDPLGDGNGPIVLLPAIRPDVALFHSPLADRDGNVWIGRRRELATMAHAAKTTLVTAEKIQEESLLADEKTAAGTLTSLYVSAVAEVEGGCRPLGLLGQYEPDLDQVRDYARQAKTPEGFRDYLHQYVLGPPAQAAQ